MKTTTIKLHMENTISRSVYAKRRATRGQILKSNCSIFDKVRPVVSNLEVIIPEKPLTPKNIGEALKNPQRQS